MSPTRVVAVAFALIILTGGLLLTLPAAARDGQSHGFLTGLFTATSATCVTGLVLGDTWTLWSGFGQTVILCLIEIGGLGFMSVASTIIFLLRKKLGLRHRMVMAQSLSVSDMASVVRLQKWAILGSIVIQLLGALVLTLRFLPDFGLEQAVIWGVFHAVSAFCNAGFDIFGKIAPNASVIIFNNDPVVCITIMALIVVGGLGFIVWEELVRVRNFRKFSVYTRMVLIGTVFLILSGAFFIGWMEWDNPATLGNMEPWQRVLNSFFQSVTARTAGYASVDQAALTDGAKATTTVLMFTGGASGSTAGGAKVVTVMVLFLFFYTKSRGRHTVCIFRRTIPDDKVIDALTITGLMLVMGVFGAIYISEACSVSFTDALFETVSALGTVGLTAGVTTKLTVLCQIMIIIFMYFGRVGILTISLGFLLSNKAEDRIQYAQTNLLIG
ncbi:MAG TPA: potassium uptake protein, TrkH family [Candidatus Faecousia excrementigallinarum]|uniref:Potassium uptake protein, TrkH family n=1 Tax=Candidatus Faecousia excrementigallinarum TaxID=2840806 RepID=A0A9D0Z4F7_9FIRM|nr:potassium uptake protein, TrkH family [Candidatus Faecousia excrementigallinarum]